MNGGTGRVEPRRSGQLIDEVEEAGLRGRGGAGFPTALKMRAVATAARRSRRRPVVVANGTESEPASSKDKVLLATSPHLVLDGIMAAATAVGAGRALLCVDRRDREVTEAARAALHERGGRDRLDVDIAEVPTRYVAGEETALVSWLNGGPAKPTYKLTRPAQRGVDAAPTLVDNVETLANLALIARFGAPAWRSVGTPEERGTTLVTVRGGVRAPVSTRSRSGCRWVRCSTRLRADDSPASSSVATSGPGSLRPRHRKWS